MKLNSGVFWGLLLVFIGLSIIIRIIFDINLFRFLLAAFLIVAGVYILFGKGGIFKCRTTGKDNIFSDRFIHESPVDKTEYNVIFGKTVYDFRDFEFKEGKTVRIKLHTVFGSSYLRINKGIPVKIKLDAVFSGATFPDGNTVVFGTNYYTSPEFNESEKHLYIEADAVFGHLQISDK